MTPIFQRVTDHDPSIGQIGDCFRAALASMLDLDLDSVPHFGELCHLDSKPDDFWLLVVKWLGSRDLGLHVSKPLSTEEMRSKGLADHYYIVFGRCEHRGDLIGHVSIGLNGQVVHDPDHTKPELVHGVEACLFLIDGTGHLLGVRQ